MNDFLIAFAGGFVGVVAGLIAAWGVAFFRAGVGVNAHDRLAAEHDEDLASWISDADLELRRLLQAKTAELSGEKNLFWSGAHGLALAKLKELQLQRYRDQLRMHRRALAALYEREGWMHAFWRWKSKKPRHSMAAPKRAEPILDAWRADVTRHCGEKGPPSPVVDPTKHDLYDALARLEAKGLKDYV